MIEYKCSKCRESMQSPDSLVNKFDKCLNCGKRNMVRTETYRLERLKDQLQYIAGEFNVAGINHKNKDGTHRQKIIAQCREMMQISLNKDNTNSHSKHAIAVFTQGIQIGYVPENISRAVYDLLSLGVVYSARIVSIEKFSTEYDDEPLLGVKIQVEWHPTSLFDLKDVLK